MRTEGEIRAAFMAFAVASQKVKTDSPEWTQFVSMAGVLGWVLGEGNYSQYIDTILREIKPMVAGRVTIDMKGMGS